MTKLIVFDLDGTLIDSRLDLTGAVNYMRASMGLEKLTLDRVVNFLGNGVNSLVRRSIADADVDFEEALQRMKTFYADHLVESTVLYPGVKSTLKELSKRGVKLAVFSNKPTLPATSILEKLGVANSFCDIIGGDAKWPLKPEPDVLNTLCQKYNFEPANCWMVGDHYTDLEAGRRAGFTRVLASYGFGDPKSEIADHIISNFTELLNLID